MVIDRILLLTVLVVLASSVVGVFLGRRKKDICLRSFHDSLVTVQLKSGKRIWGRFVVETSGVEFRYQDDYWDQDHVETSYIMYKEEVGTVHAFFRFLDQLSEEKREQRLRELKKSYHPTFLRRLTRHVRNVFNTVKDAISEAAGTALSQVKTASPALRAVATQQKRLTQLQSEVLGYVGTSYDPILEKHIGKKVVLEITRGDGVVEEHVGIFKEYSPQFLQAMDVRYPDGDMVRVCDMVVPRAIAVIRHSGESVREESSRVEPQAPVEEWRGVPPR